MQDVADFGVALTQAQAKVEKLRAQLAEVMSNHDPYSDSTTVSSRERS